MVAISILVLINTELKSLSRDKKCLKIITNEAGITVPNSSTIVEKSKINRTVEKSGETYYIVVHILLSILAQAAKNVNI